MNMTKLLIYLAAILALPGLLGTLGSVVLIIHKLLHAKSVLAYLGLLGYAMSPIVAFSLPLAAVGLGVTLWFYSTNKVELTVLVAFLLAVLALCAHVISLIALGHN